MSFLRHKEIYRDHGTLLRGQQAPCRPRSHRHDEFPVGYSWRVALQQSPLPLRQPPLIVRNISTLSQVLFLLWTERCKERKTTFKFVPGDLLRWPVLTRPPLAGFEVTTED